MYTRPPFCLCGRGYAIGIRTRSLYAYILYPRNIYFSSTFRPFRTIAVGLFSHDPNTFVATTTLLTQPLALTPLQGQ